MTSVVTFGEVMLRLSTPDHQRFEQARVLETSFAGAEANVATALANLGVSARFVSRLPANDLGTACLKALRAQGVDVEQVVRGGERIGLFFVEAGAAQRASKVIYDRARSSFATMESGMVDWATAFADAGWFHWTGITPAVGSGPAEVVGNGIDAAKSAGLTVSCDLNFRAKLWNWGSTAREVMPPLVNRCDVVIGNEEDAEKVLGIIAPDADVEKGKVEARGYLAVIEQVVKRFPNLRTVAFTLRGSLGASRNMWSALLWHEGQTYVAPTYDIAPIVDRIGGGDAFAAGLIYGLRSDGADPQSALDFAVAASCLAHSIPGDTNLVSVEEVERLAKGNASGRVAR
jgi:2-dehydro-3-deoxygluconokinase